MDWREYIQEKEHFAAPEPHIGQLLAAMTARPGATQPDEQLTDLRKMEQEYEAAKERRAKAKHKPTAQMSWDEYRERQNQIQAA